MVEVKSLTTQSAIQLQVQATQFWHLELLRNHILLFH